MSKTLNLTETTELIDAVVNTVFIETDGVLDYHPEYLELAKAYYKIWYYVPEMIIEGETISDFYIRFVNGEYKEALANYADIRQSAYIDNAIDKKVEYKSKQISNPLTYSLSRVLNAIADIAESNKNNFDNVDMQKLADGFVNLGEKFDMEKATQMIIDSVKKETKETTDKKSKLQMTTKKTTKKGDVNEK